MNLTRYGVVVYAALTCVPFPRAVDAPSQSTGPSAIAFLHANVIPMDQERVLRDQTVVIESGRIARIGAAKTTTVPPGAKKIDASGKYLIPGLVDMHVHLQSQIEFPLYLANGVTTVFNLDGRPAHLYWRDLVTKGEI